MYLCPKEIYFIKRGSITIFIILEEYFTRVTTGLNTNYENRLAFTIASQSLETIDL
ncbi:hypothetical protein [Fredinandcohnia sp. 179-A 10B2 NHS]|uniref:hypothetical protein n=1 Tax=Fredinandcohnia sp. 179-A 10B2 NHS TaxID=3235176 RepID=UPI0039A0CE5F